MLFSNKYTNMVDMLCWRVCSWVVLLAFKLHVLFILLLFKYWVSDNNIYFWFSIQLVYHADFEKAKGKYQGAGVDLETERLLDNTKKQSGVFTNQMLSFISQSHAFFHTDCSWPGSHFTHAFLSLVLTLCKYLSMDFIG